MKSSTPQTASGLSLILLDLLMPGKSGLELLGGVDEVLAKQQFLIYYQPKFNIQGKTPILTSAEALVRWKHPQLGMVSPGAFIPLFEKNGLIRRLDDRPGLRDGSGLLLFPPGPCGRI